MPLGVLAGTPSTVSTPILSLNDVLAETYKKNPDLEAVRAELKGVQELKPQAIAGFLPTVTGTADYTSSHSDLEGDTSTSSDPKTLSLEVTQSLYSGGSTLADIETSKNKINAQLAKLKVTEQKILLEGVKAFMGYIRDQEIVQLETNNEKVLDNHLKASRERFKLGNITKTDVSQAESRLAKARAGRIAAQGDLKKSAALFEKLTGLPPKKLRRPERSVNLPKTEEIALKLAEKHNPSIAYARYTADAARASTRSIVGEALPQLDLTGTASKVVDPASSSADKKESGSIGLRATFPLYAGGSTMSRVRQSRHVENQRWMETRSAERDVREAAIAAWEDLVAAEAEGRARQAQVRASGMALDGVKVEAGYGTRTTLDLLDAEQEYLDAQVAAVSAETDRVIASYALLEAIGGLTAKSLELDVGTPTLAKNFQKNKKTN